MGCEIKIAETKPRRLPKLLHALQAAEAVAVHAPAALLAEQVRQSVEHRIDVGRDVQPPPLDVVAGIDDDREVLRRDHLLQTLHQLGAAGSARENDDHCANSILSS